MVTFTLLQPRRARKLTLAPYRPLLARRKQLKIGDARFEAIAEARIEIAQCRQLCYLAACVADDRGFKAAAVTPVSVNKTVLLAQALALQSSSRNCSPAPDLVL